jgi:hypothetical protein
MIFQSDTETESLLLSKDGSIPIFLTNLGGSFPHCSSLLKQVTAKSYISHDYLTI